MKMLEISIVKFFLFIYKIWILRPDVNDENQWPTEYSIRYVFDFLSRVELLPFVNCEILIFDPRNQGQIECLMKYLATKKKTISILCRI